MMTSSPFKKIVRLETLALSFFVLVFHLVCIASVSSGTEVTIDCDQLLLNEPFKDYDKERIREIQKILRQSIHESVPSDGIVGPLTIAAAKTYCHTSESYKLTEQDLEALKSQSEVPEEIRQLEGKIIPDEIIEMVKLLQNVEYPNEELLRQALREIAGVTEPYESQIIKQARKVHLFSDYQDKEINWTGGGCGCVLEDLSGVVYGFYPFWLAAPEQEDERSEVNEEERETAIKGDDHTQIIDFSVLSRIGYYAVSLDLHGHIVDNEGKRIEFPTSDKDDGKADFINVARDHRTKMDLVVYVDKWKWKVWRLFDWGTFQGVTDRIVAIITRKLTNRLINRVKPVITFGNKPVPSMWDGITLYFEGQGDGNNTDAGYFILTFIRELREKLNAAGEGPGLNILLSMDAIVNGNGLFSFEVLERLIPDKEKGEYGYEDRNYVDYFLVFLGEPTTKSKKELRREIEDHFKGVQRKIMLRKIIPVITPTGHDEQQLKDDLIYFKDNFGGVGIWPLPLITGQECEDEEAAEIQTKRTQVINRNLKEGQAPVLDICRFVCPNRWYFRIAWGMSLAVQAVLCLCYFISCKVRHISCCYRLYAGLILAALLLLTVPLHVVLLDCDPHRSFEITDRVTIIGGVVYVVAVVILVQLFRRKGEQP
jgi:hypothetical protein